MVNYKENPRTNQRNRSSIFTDQQPPPQKRLTSYDKHFLGHTDVTHGGLGNSYPHRKDFDWNLIFLKQSWGTQPKPRPTLEVTTSKQESRKNGRNTSLSSIKAKVENEVAHFKKNKFSEKKSKSAEPRFVSSGKKSHRERHRVSRNTLDSIPEHKTLDKMTSTSTIPRHNHNRHNMSSFDRTNSQCSQATSSTGATSRSCSSYSGTLPPFSSLSSSRSTSRRSSSLYPGDVGVKADPERYSRKMSRRSKVKCTIKPDVLRTEQSKLKPSIFRDNSIEARKLKLFNPKYHGEITRPALVDSFAFKHPLPRSVGSQKWLPVKTEAGRNQNWTVYNTMK